MNILVVGNIACGKSTIIQALVDSGVTTQIRYYSLDSIRQRYSDGTYAGEFYAVSLFFRALQSERQGIFEFSGVGRNSGLVAQIIKNGVGEGREWRAVHCWSSLDTIAERLPLKKLDVPIPYFSQQTTYTLLQDAIAARKLLVKRINKQFWGCPELVVLTDKSPLDECTEKVLEWLKLSENITQENFSAFSDNENFETTYSESDSLCKALVANSGVDESFSSEKAYHICKIAERVVLDELPKGLLGATWETAFLKNVKPSRALKFIDAVGMTHLFFPILVEFEHRKRVAIWGKCLKLVDKAALFSQKAQDLKKITETENAALLWSALLIPLFESYEKKPTLTIKQFSKIEKNIGSMFAPFEYPDSFTRMVSSLVVTGLLSLLQEKQDLKNKQDDESFEVMQKVKEKFPELNSGVVECLLTIVSSSGF
jgi:hypothetical protein